MSREVRWAKLDADLSELLRSVSHTEKIPVVVTARTDALDEVLELVDEMDGEVRHVLQRLGAVSAWLTVDAIARMSLQECVGELELVQSTVPAR